MTESGEQGEDFSQRGGIPSHDGGRIGFLVSGVLVVTFVGLLALALFGPLWRSPPAFVAAGILVMPYLFVGYTALAFGVWAMLPDRSSLGVLCGVSALSMLGIWGPVWPSKAEKVVEGTPIRVMSYNVRRLWGPPSNEAPSVDCVTQTILDERPDIVSFLEVSRNNVTALESRLGLDCVYSPYRETAASDVGGLAVCVSGETWSLAGGKPMRYRDENNWFYVFSEVEAAGHVVNVLAVHLYPYSVSSRAFLDGELANIGRSSEAVIRAQGAQSAALLERVERFRDPTVLAGDFNSTRDFALHKALRRYLTDSWERGGVGFGSTIELMNWLPLRVDYIYATNEFGVMDARVVNAECSDHRPVVSDLIIRDSR